MHFKLICCIITSVVTIIIVTILIATFYRSIVLLSQYFQCVRDDIFAWHICNSNMNDSPPVC